MTGSRDPAWDGEKNQTATQQQERTKKRKRFPHGNYTGYYTTRYGINPNAASGSPASSDPPASAPAGAQDPRLGLMRRSWFEGKKCLDVGCNEGYLTLALVRTFRPRRMVGVDIDSYLVHLARRALQAEINAASDADETTAFRPLMPRSLRGGGARATLPSTSSAGDACPGGKQAEVGNDKAKRPRNEKNNASSDGGDCGAGGGIGSGGDDSCSTSTIAEAAAPGASGKKSGYGRRKTDTSDSDKDPVLPGPPGVVITGVTSGSGADGHSRDAGALERVKAERLGASVDDSATDIDGRSTDEIASAPAPPAAESAAVPAAASAIGATAASAVAAGTVAAAAAADAKVLSGCAVSFRCEDFVAEDHGDHGYDVICLFSIVKWIHINGGDEALREVFQKAYGLLQHGGRLVLEPQPWKSYRKSARQHGSAEARKIVGKIKLRPSDFPALLTEEVGFRSWEEIGLPAEGVGGFAKRSVHVFVK